MKQVSLGGGVESRIGKRKVQNRFHAAVRCRRLMASSYAENAKIESIVQRLLGQTKPGVLIDLEEEWVDCPIRKQLAYHVPFGEMVLRIPSSKLTTFICARSQ